MSHSFVAYIDESGDDGLGKFREPFGRGGASNWLVISACVFRQTYDLDAVQWRDEIGAILPNRRRRDIHFVDLNHGQRTAATKILAAKPMRTISILYNKREAPANTYTEKNQLYFYITRYLIERISWLCRDMRRVVPHSDGRVKITFSRRGGMSYGDFRAYMLRLRDKNDPDGKIHWPVIDIDGIDAKDHSSLASLQIVDIVAASFAAGIEPDAYGNCEPRYAAALKRIVYGNNGKFLSYGVKLVPRLEGMSLSSEQMNFVGLFK